MTNQAGGWEGATISDQFNKQAAERGLKMVGTLLSIVSDVSGMTVGSQIQHVDCDITVLLCDGENSSIEKIKELLRKAM